ncbi:hypothetical protein DFH27DRAFT_574672 [Peziza echinospora]|nr:hypothetical protein DFH27DRAFT_574672 [Peziza echinospora]
MIIAIFICRSFCFFLHMYTPFSPLDHNYLSNCFVIPSPLISFTTYSLTFYLLPYSLLSFLFLFSIFYFLIFLLCS